MTQSTKLDDPIDQIVLAIGNKEDVSVLMPSIEVDPMLQRLEILAKQLRARAPQKSVSGMQMKR